MNLRPIVVAVLAASTVRAQVAATGAGPAVDEWAVATELGVNAARGNSVYSMLTSGLRVTHLNKNHFELDWNTALTYGEGNGKVIARRMLTGLKADYRPTATWSPFVFSTIERDRIRRLDLLSNTGIGAKWTYFRNAAGAASVSLAAIHSYKAIMVQTPAPPGIEPRSTTARLSLRPKVVQRHPSGVSIEQTSFFQPAVDDAADYMIESSTRINFVLTRTSSMFVQHSYRADSRPPLGIKREDHLLVAGVKVSL
jgi:hypothetical protein